MAERVAELGIKREPGWLYFLRDSGVWRVPMKLQWSGVSKAEIVREHKIERDPAFLYWLDPRGDIMRQRRVGPSAKPSKTPEVSRG